MRRTGTVFLLLLILFLPISASAVRSYDYAGEILALAARIVLTIALELLVAFCFGYRGKRVFALLAVVNVVTQVFLNVFLNVVHYRSGPWDFTFC